MKNASGKGNPFSPPLPPRPGYQSPASTSPPAGVTAAQNVSTLTDGEIVRTLPSANTTIIPPS